MDDKYNHKPNQEKPADNIQGTIKQPSLTIDYALYEKYLNEADMTDTQKREFLDALWLVIVAFVDLGFGVHPLQQVSGAKEGECGQLDIPAEFLPDETSHMIECSQPLNLKPEKIADGQFDQPETPAHKGSKK